MNQDLPEYVQRLIKERDEAQERRIKLAAFTESPAFEDISIRQQFLLNKQRAVMADYVFILNQRIEDLTK